MSYNQGGRKLQDASRINVHEDWELRYWADRWHVSRQQLMEAIKRVGVHVQDVARALGKS